MGRPSGEEIQANFLTIQNLKYFLKFQFVMVVVVVVSGYPFHFLFYSSLRTISVLVVSLSDLDEVFDS